MMTKSPSAKVAAVNTYQIEVRLKDEFTDADGLAVLSLLHSSGLTAAKQVRTAKIYQIRGPLTLSHIHQAAKELLSDDVTQEYRLVTPKPVLNGMNHWRVEVWLKPSVTDPVGQSTLEAFSDIGLPTPQTVRVASIYIISGHCGRHQLEKIILRSLANPLIHRISISEAAL